MLPVQAILNRVNPKDLIQIYGLTEFNTVQEFLTLIAKRFGKINKGGRLNLEASAKKVLHDWNCGKLKYYTIPPEKLTSTIDVKLVNEIAKEFDLNDMVTYEQMMDENLEQFNIPIEDSFAIKTIVTEIQTNEDDVCMEQQQQTNDPSVNQSS
ncbi:hypothetical protein BLA29_012703, partial [Euroglyphus maynei]